MYKILCKTVVIIALLSLIGGCNQQAIQNTPIDNASDTSHINIIEPIKDIKYVYHINPSTDLSLDAIKQSLDQIEELSSAVVKATVVESKPNPYLDEKEYITLTTIKIDKVLKSDGNVTEGENYTLVEYYRQQKNKDDPGTIHIFSLYSIPLKTNKQYLLFLAKSRHSYGDYVIAGLWQGKFPLTDKTLSSKIADLTSEEMEFPDEVPLDMLWKIAQEAYDKYLN